MVLVFVFANSKIIQQFSYESFKYEIYRAEVLCIYANLIHCYVAPWLITLVRVKGKMLQPNQLLFITPLSGKDSI